MKILIIKPSSLGDIIQAAPVAAALRSVYPQAAVKWLVFKAWEEVIDLFPDVSGKIVWDRDGGVREYLRILKTVREEKCDLVIDLQGLARTAIIAGYSKAGKIIGVPGMKEFGWLLVEEVFPESANMNATLRNLETVRFLTGRKQEPVFNIRVPEDAVKGIEKILEQNGVGPQDRVIGFIPTSRGAAKTWPAGYYDDLARMVMKRRDVKIVALGASGDGKELNNPEIIDITGRTSISALAAVLLRCSLVVGGDTGPTHIAAALGVPTIMIFGGSDAGETAPVSPSAIIVSKRQNCSPCRSKPSCRDYPCLTGITPDEIFAEVRKLLWK